VTSLTRTPAALAAYLRRATWGLPRERQQELWDELEDHLLTRVDQLCALGADPEQALSQALGELGPPTRVSAGMTQVYLMPKLILSAAAAALALSAALYAGAGGGGSFSILPTPDTQSTKPVCFKGGLPSSSDIPIISQKDGVICVTPDQYFYSGAFVTLRDLKSALESQGGRARFLTPTRLDVQLPGLGGGILDAFFTQSGQGYVPAASVVVGMGTPQTVTVRGFDIPEIRMGSVHLRIGNGTQPEIGKNFYQRLVSDLIDCLVIPNRQEAHSLTVIGFVSNEGNVPTHTLQTGLNPGEVVMLMTRARKGQAEYLGDVAPVQPDGSVRLVSSSSRLRFVTDPAQLTPSPSDGRVPALLVRVTNVPLNNLKAGILTPAQPTSDAPR